jgi:hypothetical protein
LQSTPTTSGQRDGAAPARRDATPRHYRDNLPRNPGATDEIMRLRKEHPALFIWLSDLIGTDTDAWFRAMRLIAHAPAVWTEYLSAALAVIPTYPAGFFDDGRMHILVERYHQIRVALETVTVPPVPEVPTVEEAA